jgi:hypothetical protein
MSRTITPHSVRILHFQCKRIVAGPILITIRTPPSRKTRAPTHMPQPTCRHPHGTRMPPSAWNQHDAVRMPPPALPHVDSTQVLLALHAGVSCEVPAGYTQVPACGFSFSDVALPLSTRRWPDSRVEAPNSEQTSVWHVRSCQVQGREELHRFNGYMALLEASTGGIDRSNQILRQKWSWNRSVGERGSRRGASVERECPETPKRGAPCLDSRTRPMLLAIAYLATCRRPHTDTYPHAALLLIQRDRHRRRFHNGFYSCGGIV